MRNMNTSPVSRHSSAGVKLQPILPAAEGHSQYSNTVGGHLGKPRGSADIYGAKQHTTIINQFNGRK
jgi:hypothetical protein